MRYSQFWPSLGMAMAPLAVTSEARCIVSLRGVVEIPHTVQGSSRAVR